MIIYLTNAGVFAALEPLPYLEVRAVFAGSLFSAADACTFYFTLQ